MNLIDLFPIGLECFDLDIIMWNRTIMYSNKKFTRHSAVVVWNLFKHNTFDFT